MSLRINEVIIIFLVVQLLLFFLYLTFRKGSNRQSNRLLGLFFLSLGINFFHLLISRIYFLLPRQFIHLTYIGAPFAYLYAPVFYFYIRHIIKNPVVEKRDLIFHLLPFIGVTVYFSLSYYFKSADEKMELLISSKAIPKILYHILLIGLQVQVLLYFISGIYQVMKYRRKIKNYFSSIERIKYTWLKNFILILLFLYSVDILRYLSHFISNRLVLYTEIILITGFVVLCYWIIYKAVTQPVVLFTGMSAQKPLVNLSVSLKNKYTNTLLRYMNSHKPYLKPELTLHELSYQVSIPVRTLSDILNKELNKTFYDFVNSYRIKEAQDRIENSNDNKTILEILYEVGFNSKSSFNTMFKKNTGLTPTQYKLKMLKQEQKLKTG